MPPCSATVPDRNVSGDNLYGPRICWQEFVDWAWSAHGFQNDTWDDGFGYEDPCNSDLPVARTLSALWLLNYSAEDYNNEDWNNNILHWGRRYVRDQMDDLRAGCGDGGDMSATIQSWFIVRLHAHVELYQGFFYEFDVAQRVAAIIHETRHLGGKAHDANFPPGSIFGTGNQADSNWSYEGAWMYTVLYLWWFYDSGRRTSAALRQSARQLANVLIDNAFATHPGFTISDYNP